MKETIVLERELKKFEASVAKMAKALKDAKSQSKAAMKSLELGEVAFEDIDISEAMKLAQNIINDKQNSDEKVKELEQRITQLEQWRPPQIGWISQKDFCIMAGRDGKDGKRIAINRSTFNKMVQESNGLIKIVKIKGLVWVVDYPGKASSKSA